MKVLVQVDVLHQTTHEKIFRLAQERLSPFSSDGAATVKYPAGAKSLSSA